jgi:hypothetical protein
MARAYVHGSQRSPLKNDVNATSRLATSAAIKLSRHASEELSSGSHTPVPADALVDIRDAIESSFARALGRVDVRDRCFT